MMRSERWGLLLDQKHRKVECLYFLWNREKKAGCYAGYFYVNLIQAEVI